MSVAAVTRQRPNQQQRDRDRDQPPDGYARGLQCRGGCAGNDDAGGSDPVIADNEIPDRQQYPFHGGIELLGSVHERRLCAAAMRPA
jgi:hypothetical protein